MYRVWWLGIVACAAVAAHADATHWSSETIFRADPSSLAHYFNTTYPDRQVALNDALELLRSLVSYASEFPNTEVPHIPHTNDLFGYVKLQVGSWARRIGHSYTHDASGAYIGPLRGVLARLIHASTDTSAKLSRSAHTFYELPPSPLWPDWDFDVAKAQNAHLENDWPVTNGWEQAMWGPFVGQVHAPLAPRMQAIVQRHRKRLSRTALLNLLQRLVGTTEAPPVEPEPHLLAKRAHAERLLEWLAFSEPLDEATMVSDAFAMKSSGQPAQDDALWILGEHYFWGTHGVTPNATRALDCFERLSLHGNATAHARLGYLYSSAYAADMHQIPPRPDEALVHYAFAAQEKDWHARSVMAHRYRRGLGVPQDCLEAMHTYDQMARETYEMFMAGPPGGRRLPYSKIRLSDIHLSRNLEEFAWWSHRSKVNWMLYSLRFMWIRQMLKYQPRALTDKKALQRLMETYEDYALEDEPHKRYILARSHYFGSIVSDHDVLGAIPYDPEASAQHALALATARWPYPPILDDIQDESHLGPKLRPVYVAQEQDLAHQLAARAAASLLGMQYLRGDGVSQDFVRAKVWFTRAALEEDAQGIVGLGVMYLYGFGGLTPNVTKAETLFRHVSEKGLTFQVRLELGKQAMRAMDRKKAHEHFHIMNVIHRSDADGTLLLDDSFEYRYLKASLYVDDALEGKNVTTNCAISVPLLEDAVQRADWNDPIYHRAAAAYDRGDLMTALQAWSMAAESGVEEAQDNIAFILDQFTSWQHNPAPAVDDALAKHYWGQSAMQGSIHASYKLCEYMLFGLTDGDAQRAANCFTNLVDMSRNWIATVHDDVSRINLDNFAGASFDLMSAWRLGSMYAQGAPPMKRDLALAKRLFDYLSKSFPQTTNPLMFLLMGRLFFQTLWAMLQGDITARRMLLSYFPSSLKEPWSEEALSMAVELSFFITGVLGLIVLVVVRRYFQRRLTAAEAARTALLRRGPSGDAST
ncbi:Similar to S.cerevisiae protein HRD3 (ER membrane protein that plays a central role in ERAD) [Malassezia sympodialis ATCC 42132]|uniref:Similar to S.cerevisiae protein HRD3 (ER membrane protein that plays a central role in ERAD) n=1 Tax=Malassezia sympodialis (strain ATCC 42132) TaxID=1230383 RepID=A0A1M8ABV7_MALS4|nr:Similar to S.cerevisiae protein HRD3 (ER membrane protein that plays a central role in ERAD) [Malassezia sympodialis ATCC 42132]